MQIEIKNLKTEKPNMPWDIKVDRSSPLGNKFVMRNETERDAVCEQYKEWLYSELFESTIQIELLLLKNTLRRYGKLNLFCWCAPKRCHAETIREYLLANVKE